MNYGIAKGVLSSVPPELEADFTIANRIAPTLSRGLRGNPRQLKRFLNTMLLRSETARRRGVILDPAVLAKLMVLEQQQPEFQQLFLWQLNQDGTPEELASPRRSVAPGGDLASRSVDRVDDLVQPQAVRQWVGLEPPLAGVPLGQFFFFQSRSALARGARSAPLGSTSSAARACSWRRSHSGEQAVDEAAARARGVRRAVRRVARSGEAQARWRGDG